MRPIRSMLALLIILQSVNAKAQVKQYFLNDINNPELKGQVRTLREFIILNNDTLRTMYISYSKAGRCDTLITYSMHPEMGFKNDSTCYKTAGKTVTAFDCRKNRKKGTEMNIDEKGLINQIDTKYSDHTISLFPEYNAAGRLTAVNTARSGSGTFQFFAVLVYTLNPDGSIKQSEAEGGDQLQGKVEYQYSDKNLLIKTIRSGFDGSKTFTINYTAHDEKGNWISAGYENNVLVNRVIVYY